MEEEKKDFDVQDGELWKRLGSLEKDVEEMKLGLEMIKNFGFQPNKYE